ncbi:TonB family protein [Sphingorhabdus sp.]|uniref:TonB family protein n=1 Tax=Sphingorhabdus sp. TaxID=1902408 RepID=UPI003919AE70
MALIHIVVGYVILNAFDYRPGDVVRASLDSLHVFDVSIHSFVPDNKPIQASPEPEGAASAANLKKTSAPREAPKRIIEIPQPKSLPAAPKAGSGNDTDAGAADIPGQGTGAGGVGSGFGSGNSGDGPGGGGLASRAELIRGRITNADYPKSATAARQGGSVTAHFTVGANGVPSKCRVVKSSGNADIDATTCRLIEQRFRYEPARNKAGHPISDVAGWQQTWWLERGKRRFIRPEDDLPKPPPVYVPAPGDKG